jgi:hypothetical protein
VGQFSHHQAGLPRPLARGRSRQAGRGSTPRCMAVRPASTAITDQAMLYPRSDLTTLRACHAGAGRIGEHGGNGELGRLLGEDVLQRPQREAGQPGAYPQARFAALANVGEVFQGDGVPIDAPHAHAPAERIERKLIAAQGERAHVKMYAAAAEVDCRRRLVLKLAVRPHRSLSSGNRLRRIAAHLRSEWRLGTTAPLAQIGQRRPVPAPRFDAACSEQIAGSGRCGLPGRQRRKLEVAGFDQDRAYWLGGRRLGGMLAPGHLSPLVDVSRALDVVAYRVGARGAGDTDVAAGFGDSLNLAFLPRPKSRVSSEGFL